MTIDLDHPLAQAAIRGDVAALQAMELTPELVNARFDAIKDRYGYRDMTPLMVAAGSRLSNVETVRHLLVHGADVFLQNGNGETAAIAAAEGICGDYLTIGLPDEDTREANRYQEGGDSDRLRVLLDAGSDLNALSGNKSTLVAIVARRAWPNALRDLLARRAPLYPDEAALDKAEARSSAFQKSFLGDQFEELMRPLHPMPEVEVEQPKNRYYGWMCPLHNAAEAGSIECCQILLDAGVPIDFIDKDGGTALAEASSPEIARFLIAHGARIEGAASRFSTILEELLEAERYDVARVLLEAGADVEISNWGTNAANGHAGVHMDPNALRLLVEFGANLRKPGYSGGTILHTACWQGDGNGGHPDEVTEETVQYLIDQGIPLDAVDDQGSTALHEAVTGDWGSPVSVRVLLRNGANPNPRDPKGRTPLMLAAERGDLECVKALLENGADPRAKNQSDNQAIHYARRHLMFAKKHAESPGPDPFAHVLAEEKEIFGDKEIPAEYQRESYEDSILRRLREAEEVVRLIEEAMSRP